MVEEGGADDDVGDGIQFFDAVDLTHLPKLLGNQMESEHLMVLVACVRHYLRIGKWQSGVQMLDQLVRVSRFDMQVMFLDQASKHKVTSMLEDARKHLQDGHFERLRVKFQV